MTQTNENKIDVKSINFKQLKKLFKKEIFAIPHLQREFVWSKKKIVQYLDSIQKQHPTGSFLICKVPNIRAKSLRESTLLPRFNSKNKECYIIIDGQQRLSVLYSTLFKEDVKAKKYSEGINFRQISFSESEDNSFGFFQDKRLKKKPRLQDILNNNLNGKKTKKTEECKKLFENYKFPFVFIPELKENKMKEIFIRLNKGGTPLSSADQLFAESYNKETDLRQHFHSFIENKLTNGFQKIQTKPIAQAIAANLGITDVIGAGIVKLAKDIGKKNSKLHQEYINKHKKIYDSISLASDFFTRRFKNASYIPYPSMLAVLSVFYFYNNKKEPDEKQIKEIERWFWTTGFTTRYSGAKLNKNISNDIKEIKDLARKKIKTLNLERGEETSKISKDILLEKDYSVKGAITKTYFCLLIDSKPLLLENGETMEINDMSSMLNKKNDHHIFPKKILKGKYKKEKNSIMNICFLTFGENVGKETPPWNYLKKYTNKPYFKKFLKSHLLPETSNLLTKGNVDEKFDNFKKERTELVINEIAKRIGKKHIK